jgi:hypothetical protein
MQTGGTQQLVMSLHKLLLFVHLLLTPLAAWQLATLQAHQFRPRLRTLVLMSWPAHLSKLVPVLQPRTSRSLQQRMQLLCRPEPTATA